MLKEHLVDENLLLWVVESRLTRGVLEHTDLGSAKVRFHHLSELSKINTEGVNNPLDSDAVLLVKQLHDAGLHDVHLGHVGLLQIGGLHCDGALVVKPHQLPV